MYHVGSTAIRDLSGKGIIDILIGVKSWKEGKQIVRILRNIGFVHVHPKYRGRIFVSNKKISDINDIHVHIVKKDTKQYLDFLKFRDWLRKNKKARIGYSEVKKKILENVKGNREKYRKLKSRYIQSILRKLNKTNE